MFDPNKFKTEKKEISYDDRPKKITPGKKLLAPVGAAFKIKNGKKFKNWDNWRRYSRCL